MSGQLRQNRRRDSWCDTNGIITEYFPLIITCSWERRTTWTQHIGVKHIAGHSCLALALAAGRSNLARTKGGQRSGKTTVNQWSKRVGCCARNTFMYQDE